jgi:hypothetical protein
VTRAFNHHGARIAKLVWLLEEPHAFVSQLGYPGVEVGDTIGHMSAGAHKRAVSLTRVPIKRHIIEADTRPRLTDAPFPFKRRPTPPVPLHRAVGIGAGLLASGALARGRVEVLLIPEPCGERVFLVHVQVIEAILWHVPLVLDNGTVGT